MSHLSHSVLKFEYNPWSRRGGGEARFDCAQRKPKSPIRLLAEAIFWQNRDMFIKEGKTDWKFLLIAAFLAAVAGARAFDFSRDFISGKF